MQQTHGTDVCQSVKIESICVGDAWEMGFAQGSSLRKKVQSAFSILTDLEAFRLQKPMWMPMRVFRRIAENKANKFLNDALSTDFPDSHRRILGLAEGAGVGHKSLFLLNSMEAVLSDISRSSFVPIVSGCSAVAVSGSSSNTGDPILAHNFDYLPAIQPLYTVRVSRPAGKLRSLEFTAAPLCGAVDGVNEAGLCITDNYAYITDRIHAGPTISMLISEALGNCRNVPEAVEFFAKSKRWGGGLLMLGDSEGQIDSLELSSTQSALRSKTSSGDRLFHTNRFASEKMKKVEVEDSTIYSHRAPKALRNRRVHRSSDRRNRRFLERLEKIKQFDPEGLVELMSDHGSKNKPSADTICMHGDYWQTTACLQLFPKERKMRVAYDSACRAKFTDFQL